MFNRKRIEALERDVLALYDVVSRQNEDLEMILKDFYLVPVSPEKAPKKRGKTILTDGAGGSFVGKGQSSRIYEVGTIPFPAKAPKKRGRPAKKVTTKKK